MRPRAATHALRYYACMLSSGAVIALIGAAAAVRGGHASDLYDLVPRVLLVMGLACLPGAYLLFRPIARYLASAPAGATSSAYLRSLPIASAAWIFALAALTIGGHLGAAHHSWDAVREAGSAMLATIIGHVLLFASYIALYTYFLLHEFVAALRLHLWREAGVAEEPQGGHIMARMLLAFVAVGAGPAMVLLSAEAALSAPMAGQVHSQHALLRQALELDLMAAGLFTVIMVFLVARSVARPARLLLEAMQRVQSGDLATRAAVVSDDELGKLTAGFNTMVEGLAQHERTRRVFGRFVPEEVASALLAQEGAIEPQEREATVLFTDIAGFTQIASRLAPRDVLSMLNDYFAKIAAIIHAHGGVITQFQGDAVLAVFNLPAALPNHARCAADAGLEILKVEPATRVGISTGRVVGGTVGGGERLGYTVHGDTVNLAARLEALNKDLGSRILVDGFTADRLGAAMPVRSHGAVPVRGFPVPVRIYEPVGTPL